MKFRKRLPASVVARPTMSAPAIMALGQTAAAAAHATHGTAAAAVRTAGAPVTPNAAAAAVGMHSHTQHQQHYISGQAVSAPPKQVGWGGRTSLEMSGFGFAMGAVAAASPAESTPESKWRPLAEGEGMSPTVAGGAAAAAAAAIEAAAAAKGGLEMVDSGHQQVEAAAAAAETTAEPGAAAVAEAAFFPAVAAGDAGTLVVAEAGVSDKGQQEQQKQQAGPSVSYEEQQQQYVAWYAMLGMEHYQYYVDWYAQSYGLVGAPDMWAPEAVEAFNGWYGTMCWQQFQQQYGYDQQQQQEQPQQEEEQGQQQVDGQEHGLLLVEQEQQHVQEDVEGPAPEEDVVGVAGPAVVAAADVVGGVGDASAATAAPLVVRGRKSEEERVIGQLVQELHEEVSRHSLGQVLEGEEEEEGTEAAPHGEHLQQLQLEVNRVQENGWQEELAGEIGWGSELQIGLEVGEGQGQEAAGGKLEDGASQRTDVAAATAGVPAVAVAVAAGHGEVMGGSISRRVSEGSGWGSQPSTAKVAAKACKLIMATALERVLAEESSGEAAGEGGDELGWEGDGWGEIAHLVEEAVGGEQDGEGEQQQGQLVAGAAAADDGGVAEVHGNGHVDTREVGQEVEQAEATAAMVGAGGEEAGHAGPGEFIYCCLS